MCSRSKMRIAGACLNQIPMDWSGNLKNILNAIAQAKDAKVNILCLPELCLTGYGCEDMFLSDWLPKKALDHLYKIIPYTEGIAVTIGLPFIFEGSVYNTIVVIADGRILGIYAKHNLANDGVHYEPRWFNSWPYQRIENIEIYGQKTSFGSITLDIFGVRTGFEICEDAWQEDRPACHFEDRQVELILNPSASHFAFGKEEFRENLVIQSSKQFNCVYLYTNLLGNEAGRMIYDGDILIANRGQLIGHNRRLSFRSVNLLSLEFDFDKKRGEENIKSDRSDAIDEFGRAVPLALFDYLRKSKSKGFVLSLSGGADSSSIATLVFLMVKNGIDELGMDLFCEKLGIKKEDNIYAITKKLLITAYQGTVNSSNETFLSAKLLAESLGATFYHWSIDDEVESYTSKIEKAIGRKLSWKEDDISLQNIQARARSPIIWMLANIDRHLLLTTSNRSEGDVGYATMDGDTSGSISPIAAVDKHFILNWLRYAEKELGLEGLRHVNKLQPTAELRPKSASQTDEDDLMPYEILVTIEREAIRNRKSPTEVYQLLTKNYPTPLLKMWISKFYRLWAMNQWKRERIAPSFHVDDFNVDPRTWCRFPILSSAFKEELEELMSSE
jgi:NAD+ synthase (glutamine-hydrolysing)